MRKTSQVPAPLTSSAILIVLTLLLFPNASSSQTTNVTTPTTPGLSRGFPASVSDNYKVVSDVGVIDAVAWAIVNAPLDTEISQMINGVYRSSLCTNGCTIDARGASGTQLVMYTNPFANPTNPSQQQVKLLLGNTTYIACVPWTIPQAGVIVEGAGLMGSLTQGTVIKAGSTGDCSKTGAAFPNGASLITTTWQHGPFPVGTYSAVIQDGPPSQINDKFGSQWRDLTIDATIDSTHSADFCFFSASMEEKSGLFHFACRGAQQACGFWDRAFQAGTNNPGGGIGPTHFNIFDTTCDIASSTNNKTYGWVYEGAPNSIALTGVGCSAQPHAYPIMSGTAFTSSVITYAGAGCSSVSCAVNGPFGSGGSAAACTATVTGGAVTAINITAAGSKYPNSSIGSGPWIERSTLRGTSGTNQMADAIWMEGAIDPHVSDIHCEFLGLDPDGSKASCVNFGTGNAQNGGGHLESIDVANDAGGAQIVHLGAGGLNGGPTSTGPTQSADSQGTVLDALAFSGVGGTQTAVQDDTSVPLPVPANCTNCISLTIPAGSALIPHYVSGWGSQRVAMRALRGNYTATATATTPSNWVWPMEKNKTYALHCQLIYESSATTAGLQLSIAGPPSPTSFWASGNLSLSATTGTNAAVTAFGNVVSGNVVTINTFFPANLAAQITPSVAGPFQVQVATASGSATVVIEQGSWCELMDAN